MTALLDLLLDTLVPAVTAHAACTPRQNTRYGPCYDYFFTRQQVVSDCYRRADCRTYCNYYFQAC
jgi:hypothetical protein